MDTSAPVSVVSGRAYRVLGPGATAPRDLEGFVGDVAFDLDFDGTVYRVCGTGRPVDDGIRFYEKASGGLGRDVRVWAVRHDAAGDLVAEHVP